MNIGEYLLIDSHCHPHFPPLGDSVETVLADMTAAGVQAALAVATSEQEAQEVLALCKKYPERFFAACGIHPLSDDDEKDDDEAVIKLCADEKVLAVGETGLDFFRAGDSKAAQRRRFAAHIGGGTALTKAINHSHPRFHCGGVGHVARRKRLRSRRRFTLLHRRHRGRKSRPGH